MRKSCLAARADKEPICFGYNMGACESGKKPGDRCNRGFHICDKTLNGVACGKPHSRNTEGAALRLPRCLRNRGVSGKRLINGR
eukprot:3577670-Amphidinium_carterae.1